MQVFLEKQQSIFSQFSLEGRYFYFLRLTLHSSDCNDVDYTVWDQLRLQNVDVIQQILDERTPAVKVDMRHFTNDFNYKWAVLERFGKTGKPTAAHLHICFTYDLPCKVENLKANAKYKKWRDWLYTELRAKLAFTSLDEQRVNNRTDLRVVKTMDAEFLTYCFKEWDKQNIPCWGIIPQEIRAEIQSVAVSIYTRTCEDAERREARFKDGWYSVMKEIWTQEKTPLNPRALLLRAWQHAAEEEKPVQEIKLAEAVKLYLLIRGVLNKEQVVESMLSKYF